MSHLGQRWPKKGLQWRAKGSAGSMVGCCWVPPPLFSLPSTPVNGEVGRQGEGRDGLAPACMSMLFTPGKGKALRQGVGCCVVAESSAFDRPAAPSARGGGGR
jgi:hypothetical protein